MNANDVIREVQEDLFEWIEMSDNPAMFIAGVLANKIISLNDHIAYLERRLNNVKIISNINH